VNVPA
jgi:hypothetical protein